MNILIAFLNWIDGWNGPYELVILGGGVACLLVLDRYWHPRRTTIKPGTRGLPTALNEKTPLRDVRTGLALVVSGVWSIVSGRRLPINAWLVAGRCSPRPVEQQGSGIFRSRLLLIQPDNPHLQPSDQNRPVVVELARPFLPGVLRNRTEHVAVINNGCTQRVAVRSNGSERNIPNEQTVRGQQAVGHTSADEFHYLRSWRRFHRVVPRHQSGADLGAKVAADAACPQSKLVKAW